MQSHILGSNQDAYGHGICTDLLYIVGCINSGVSSSGVYHIVEDHDRDFIKLKLEVYGTVKSYHVLEIDKVIRRHYVINPTICFFFVFCFKCKRTYE